MFHEFYQNIPLQIDPIAFSIGSFSVRWYGLSYLVGFVVVYLFLSWRIRMGEADNIFQISNFKFPPRRDKLGAKISKQILNSKSKIYKKIQNTKYQIRNIVLDFLLISFFAALVGGRLGYVLFYNLPYYIANPIAVISPYDSNGQFIGLFGMSYHGALVGIIIASWIFFKKRDIGFMAWADFVVPSVALGYFFGRVGNFLNGELYGRVTDSPLGMHFFQDRLQLRHPSQLYEALLEGVLLFVILWKMRRSKLRSGTLFGAYLLGYGLLRIFGEQFRQPDMQIGFLWNYFSVGQMLSFVMVLSAFFILIPKKEK